MEIIMFDTIKTHLLLEPAETYVFPSFFYHLNIKGKSVGEGLDIFKKRLEYERTNQQTEQLALQFWKQRISILKPAVYLTAVSTFAFLLVSSHWLKIAGCVCSFVLCAYFFDGAHKTYKELELLYNNKKIAINAPSCVWSQVILYTGTDNDLLTKVWKRATAYYYQDLSTRLSLLIDQTKDNDQIKAIQDDLLKHHPDAQQKLRDNQFYEREIPNTKYQKYNSLSASLPIVFCECLRGTKNIQDIRDHLTTLNQTIPSEWSTVK